MLIDHYCLNRFKNRQLIGRKNFIHVYPDYPFLTEIVKILTVFEAKSQVAYKPYYQHFTI
jgi:hypothetical protein